MPTACSLSHPLLRSQAVRFFSLVLGWVWDISRRALLARTLPSQRFLLRVSAHGPCTRDGVLMPRLGWSQMGLEAERWCVAGCGQKILTPSLRWIR